MKAFKTYIATATMPDEDGKVDIRLCTSEGIRPLAHAGEFEVFGMFGKAYTLAEVAPENEAAELRRCRAIEQLTRLDPNGTWSDEDNAAEGNEVLTLEDAEAALSEIRMRGMTAKELAAQITFSRNAVADDLLKAGQCARGDNYRNESDGKPEFLKAQQYVLKAIMKLEELEKELNRRWAEQANEAKQEALKWREKAERDEHPGRAFCLEQAAKWEAKAGAQ